MLAKKFARWTLLLILPYLVIELISLGIFFVLEGEGFSYERVEARRQASLLETPIGDGPQSPGVPKYIPHPYLGFVANPAKFGGQHHWWIRQPNAPIEQHDDIFYVAIAGGSVAFNLFTEWDVLRKSIEGIPAARDKRVEFFLLATAGYKQPQQLQAVSLYLALGGKIDILINIDGFNEIASEIDRNFTGGVHPVYPSMWQDVTRDLRGGEDLEGLAWRFALRRARSNVARAFEPLWFSVTANLTWHLLNQALERWILQLTGEDVGRYEAPRFSRGPEFRGDVGAYQISSVGIWRNASRVLAGIADRERFEYFHFLQPNQYVPGTKRFTAAERKALLGNDRYRKLVPTGYRQLQAAGGKLQNSGVRFHDLTGIFRDTEETVFADDCCHMNKLGRGKLATEIGRRIVNALGQRD